MDIDRNYFSDLTELHYESAAKGRARKKGMSLSRKLYVDGNTIIKSWPARSVIWNSVYISGRPQRYHNARAVGVKPKLPAIACGLVDDSVCPAFLDHIYENGKLVGYVTRRGELLGEDDMFLPDAQSFIENLMKRTVISGHIYRDLHCGNLIRLSDGQISLIDLETPIARIEGLDLDEEIQTGALRRGVLRPYRRFVLNKFDIRQVDSTATDRSLFDAAQNSPGPSEEYEPVKKEDIEVWIARMSATLAEIRGVSMPQKLPPEATAGKDAPTEKTGVEAAPAAGIREWLETRDAKLQLLRRSAG